jgi:hypothetical protein
MMPTHRLREINNRDYLHAFDMHFRYMMDRNLVQYKSHFVPFHWSERFKICRLHNVFLRIWLLHLFVIIKVSKLFNISTTSLVA